MLGIAVGFIGLSGVAAMLLEKNTVLVTCVFIGFILGAFPKLWPDSGTEGKTKFSVLSLGVCFPLMLSVPAIFKDNIILLDRSRYRRLSSLRLALGTELCVSRTQLLVCAAVL